MSLRREKKVNNVCTKDEQEQDEMQYQDLGLHTKIFAATTKIFFWVYQDFSNFRILLGPGRWVCMVYMVRECKR